MKELARKSSEASKALTRLNNETRSQILGTLASNLLDNIDRIIAANKKDLSYAEEINLNQSMLDRLMLDEKRIQQMVAGVIAIQQQPDIVGGFFDEFQQNNGLSIKKQRVPLGVILMIFESRPNVVVDCAALAIKSSNAIILKGGKEAKFSNEILGEIIQESISAFIPKESVQVLASDKREVINELIEMDQYIDVVIPRGGHRLIEYVTKNSRVPVIAHYQGLCHMYFDKDADVEKAIKLAVNAKTQRTGVCNAIETLIIHESLLPEVANKLSLELTKKKTELRVDKAFREKAGSEYGHLALADSQDWETEYLDNILSIKTVKNIDEAISHIAQYGSKHSECIVSENKAACDKFLTEVDASCVMINASTRFNDGGQLGLGAELGISTTKLHAYGPMGAAQMTTSRFVVSGNGQIRE